MARDLYEVLGVRRDATLAAIRDAYRQRAAVLHPSKGGNQAAFAELQEAYATLCNPTKRQSYDNASLQVAAAPRLDSVRLIQGGMDEIVEVPAHFDKPVAHLIVSERGGARTLQLANAALEAMTLKAGEVLVAMRAVPLSSADLNLEHVFQAGDYFGLQGVGQAVLLGPGVKGIQKGDWLLPLRPVDEEGDLLEETADVGLGRGLLVMKEARCVPLTLPQKGFSISQLALVKAIAAAFRMVEEFAQGLERGASVAVNGANGVVGQCLVQLLARVGFMVFAVMRYNMQSEEDDRSAQRHLMEMGASKVIYDDDDIKECIERADASLPQLAFDGVGGQSTARLASALSKTGDIVCYGNACGSKTQVLPSGWGKKWKGAHRAFSLEEWLHKDLAANTGKLCGFLAEASKLLQSGRLIVDVEEYSPTDFARALENMKRRSRTAAVVLNFPRTEEEATSNSAVELAQSQVATGPRNRNARLPPAPTDITAMPTKASWDIDFLQWEEEEEDAQEKCAAAEKLLFQQDPVMEELRVMPFVDDALAAPVALEIGAEKGEATHVLFWLPGAGEVPEEHSPWLSRLAAIHPGLRALILKPRTGFKWYETSDAEAVALGLRFLVLDDIENNLEGDVRKAAGELAFPMLKTGEVEALQQIEAVSMALARRAVIEEKESPRVPFLFGGFGQGGTVALFAAVCLMETPVSAVLFSHSGVPAAGMLGKRLSEKAKKRTHFMGVYDKADKEVPVSYAEELQNMLNLLGCRMSMEWLQDGDGHDFFDDAAAVVSQCFTTALEEKAAEVEDDRPLVPPPSFVATSKFGEQWRQSVARRGGKVSEVVLRGAPLQVA